MQLQGSKVSGQGGGIGLQQGMCSSWLTPKNPMLQLDLPTNSFSRLPTTLNTRTA